MGGWRMPIRVMTIAAAAIAAVAIGSALPANAQPRSAITDIDLPEGTVPCSSSGCRAPAEHEEVWRYDRPYEDVVAFFQNEFGTGSHDDLSRCPPSGPADAHEWTWSNDARWLAIAVFPPGFTDPKGNSVPFGKIYIACGPVNPRGPGGQCVHAYKHW
jgi:hypothetical protein